MIEPSELRSRALEEQVDLVDVLHVGLHRNGARSQCLDLPHGRVGRIRIARVMYADEARALLRQHQRRGAANPP